MVREILFAGFAVVSILRAVGVLVAPHPVHSVLFLVLVFMNGSGLLLLLEAEVLALLFLMVYVGAIAVLFLFVVMMLDLKRRPLMGREIWPIVPAGLLLVVGFLGQLVFAFESGGLKGRRYLNWAAAVDPLIGLEPLGQVLYTHYVLQLLVAGLVLLVALIGGIALVLPVAVVREDRPKRQHLRQQMSRQEQRGRFLVDF